jgi:hypothetical protein
MTYRGSPRGRVNGGLLEFGCPSRWGYRSIYPDPFHAPPVRRRLWQLTYFSAAKPVPSRCSHYGMNIGARRSNRRMRSPRQLQSAARADGSLAESPKHISDEIHCTRRLSVTAAQAVLACACTIWRAWLGERECCCSETLSRSAKTSEALELLIERGVSLLARPRHRAPKQRVSAERTHRLQASRQLSDMTSTPVRRNFARIFSEVILILAEYKVPASCIGSFLDFCCHRRNSATATIGG